MLVSPRKKGLDFLFKEVTILAEFITKKFLVRYFRKPLRGPPTHGVRKPPSNQKRKSKKPGNPDYPQK